MVNALDAQEDRTYYDVLWQSFIIVVSVGWISIHLNVPTSENSRYTTYRRRVTRLIVLALILILPELALVWAVRQRCAAKALGQRYKEHGWTTTHGFFLVMGGFKLHENGKSGDQMRVSKFEELLQEQRIAFPDITETEILDKSKKDQLAQNLLLATCLEYWARLFFRVVQKLHVTRLESLTGTVAFILLVIRFIWRSKPMDIICPVPVHIIPDSISTSCGGSSAVKTMENEQDSYTPPQEAPRKPSPLRRVLDRLELAFLCLLQPFSQMMGTVSDNDSLSNEFYSPNSPDLDGIVPAVALGLGTALLIGAIHCSSWNVSSSSSAVLTLWRICSVATTVLPLVFCILAVVVSALYHNRRSAGYALPVVSYITLAVAFLHVVIRLMIIALIFVEIGQKSHRNADVYTEIKWFKLFPRF